MFIDPQREELIREELGRIVASDLFCRSDRLCRFLRFSVEQALRGESDRVKEYVVAVEAYGRPASFDSRVDPVVRVEARRLRDRLKTWYEGEGRNARIRIELPRGGYAALFHDPASASAPKHEPAPAQRTMAVLPFANLNAGPENDYLCDGLTEELIHSLTKVRELRVVAWNSAARMKRARTGPGSHPRATGRRNHSARQHSLLRRSPAHHCPVDRIGERLLSLVRNLGPLGLRCLRH